MLAPLRMSCIHIEVSKQVGCLPSTLASVCAVQVTANDGQCTQVDVLQ